MRNSPDRRVSQAVSPVLLLLPFEHRSDSLRDVLVTRLQYMRRSEDIGLVLPC